MKNERIAQAKKRIREWLRSLAARFRRFGPPQPTSDLRRGPKLDTLMLREKTWRIEMSRSKAKKFFIKNKIAIVAAVAVLATGIVTRYVLIGFASTVDFYPSSCLGNWENVQNALGKPDLTSGASPSAFTTLNSAVFGTSTAQMFCGNFSGDTDIDTLMGKSFQSADLVLSWSFVFPEAVIVPSGGNGGGGGGGGGSEGGAAAVAPSNPDDISSTTDATDTSSSPPPPATIAPASPPAVATDTDVDANNGTTTDTADADATSTATAPTSTQIAQPEPATTPTTTPTSSDGMSDASDASSTPPPAPAPVPPPAPAPIVPATTTAPVTAPDTSGSSSDAGASSPTSWLRKFIGVAYADGTSSLATAASTTQLANTSTTLMVASSVVQGTPSAPEPSPININTSMFQNIILPSSTADEVLAIVYSTDGVTWQPLANIGVSNWQQGRYPIPIDSWEELQHLQIAFVGLGASSSPQIFLDSAGVEVSYIDTPEATTDITSSTDQGDAVEETTATSSWIPPSADAIIQKPTISENDVFQQGARQQCVVAPFSGTVAPGGNTNFSLDLFSGLTKPTSSAAAVQHAVYQTQVGSLPIGISATITPGTSPSDVSSTQVLRVSALSNAPPGSYSVLIIYRERQNDASMRSTGCQMNVVVP